MVEPVCRINSDKCSGLVGWHRLSMWICQWHIKHSRYLREVK